MEQCWGVGGDEVGLVCDAPLQVIGAVHCPNVHFQPQCVHALYPVGVLCAEDIYVLVGSGGSHLFELFGGIVATEIVDGCALGGVLQQVGECRLAECDVIDTFL